MYRFLACCAVAILAAARPAVADPLTDLAAFSPPLAQLYATYPNQVPQLRTYARSQDFTDPHEELAIVAHELIHISSAAHEGYWVRGTIYEGYEHRFWRGVIAQDVETTDGERNQMAAILNNYWERNPSNDLGNVVDELNAYSETAGFVCEYAASRSARQTAPLLGHLTLTNAFLRAFRTRAPERYAELRTNPATRGIISAMVQQSYRTLANCGIRQIAHQEEIKSFLGW